MNTRTCIPLVGAMAFAVLLACSTPKPVAPVAAASPPVPTLTDLEIFETPDMPPWPEPFGQICKLGTSCLAMDPRPFEFCLLSTKDCRDKATEPLLVGQPPSISSSGDYQDDAVTSPAGVALTFLRRGSNNVRHEYREAFAGMKTQVE